jgi:ribosomal-protein-alanine N-acetyltransferase
MELKNPGIFSTIETGIKNVILRRFEHTDEDNVAFHANNSKIAHFLTNSFPNPYSIEDARAFISTAKDFEKKSIFTIDIDGKASGAIGLHFQNDVYRYSAELGYWLGETHWGKGIMTASVKAIIGHALDDIGLIRIYARVFHPNLASRKVLENAGFDLEGIARKSVVKNGEVLDAYMFALVK